MPEIVVETVACHQHHNPQLQRRRATWAFETIHVSGRKVDGRCILEYRKSQRCFSGHACCLQMAAAEKTRCYWYRCDTILYYCRFLLYLYTNMHKYLEKNFNLCKDWHVFARAYLLWLDVHFPNSLQPHQLVGILLWHLAMPPRLAAPMSFCFPFLPKLNEVNCRVRRAEVRGFRTSQFFHKTHIWILKCMQKVLESI